MTIYRIAQEAISNAQRHACASHAEIELAYLPGTLRLSVDDDGHGFDYAAKMNGAQRASAAPEARSGLGLLGMRERASLVGAHLEIASALGAGTRVTLLVQMESGTP
jgi:signal transduction histidine kinase